MQIPSSELPLNPDGSVYHLKLHPHQIAHTIILVGDPGRVAEITKHFDRVDHVVTNREFITHTGLYKGKPLTVLATGIGTDNIDIVLNELDALVNVDLETRTPKPELTKLNLIRIGTSGALHANIAVDSFVVSEFALGIDGTSNFYPYTPNQTEQALSAHFVSHTSWGKELAYPFAAHGNEALVKLLAQGNTKGITITANGFYGAQGRNVRGGLRYPNLNTLYETFEWQSRILANYEMETSALYTLSNILGHNAATICLIVANRVTKQFSANYKAKMEELIQQVLTKLSAPAN